MFRKNCKTCGKIFWTYPSHNQEYCSRECYWNSMDRRQKRKCLYCSKKFEVFSYSIKQDYGKFCSSLCYGKSMKGKKRKPHTEKSKKIMSEKRLGFKFTPESIEKMRKSHLGQISVITGKTWEEFFGRKKAKKMKERLSNMWKGDKCKWWQGGISNKPYPFNFNLKLKKFIRKRDNYTCQLCGRKQEKELKTRKRKLAVHHIDYDKNNLNSDNLIALCNYCHQKTNTNRKYWKQYFYSLTQ